jgi:hypothetical protein
MTWYAWFAFVAFLYCLAGFVFHFSRLIRLGVPRDFSRPAGTPGSAIVYSFTGAMDPRKKESAYLHLPTYTAGLFYHGGTFVSFLVFVLFFFFGIRPVEFWKWLAIATLSLSGMSGLSILVKRIVLEKLRSLSSPDDYLSNILLTIFQLLTVWMLLSDSVVPFYYLWSGLLLLYIPVGKLKHVVYFFAARVHAGFFYGRRGIWPAARP